MRVLLLVVCFAVMMQASSTPVEGIVREFMRGAQLDKYIQDSTKCLDSIKATGESFASLFSLIKEHKAPNSTVELYPDVLLSGTDILGTFSPLARSCFYSSMEAKTDITDYIKKFDSFMDYASQVGVKALANYFTLRKQITTIVYDITYAHNATLASFHIGELTNNLLLVEPATPVNPD